MCVCVYVCVFVCLCTSYISRLKEIVGVQDMRVCENIYNFFYMAGDRLVSRFVSFYFVLLGLLNHHHCRNIITDINITLHGSLSGVGGNGCTGCIDDDRHSIVAGNRVAR